jgi:hypothetical protein
MKLRHCVTVLLCCLVGGCAWVENMMTRPVSPDTRTQLEVGQHMEFGRITRRNAQGRYLDEFKCPDKHMMVCEAPATSWDCTCRMGDL